MTGSDPKRTLEPPLGTSLQTMLLSSSVMKRGGVRGPFSIPIGSKSAICEVRRTATQYPSPHRPNGLA